MGKSMATMLDNEQAGVLNSFLEEEKNRGSTANLHTDAKLMLAQGKDLASFDLREIITETVSRVKELKEADPKGFKFSVDAQDNLDMLRNYREGDSLSEAKAKLALRKTLNGALDAIQKYSGDNVEISRLKSEVAESRAEIISGLRAKKFTEGANIINSKYDDMKLQVGTTGYWSKAAKISEFLDNEKADGVSNKAQVAHNTITDWFKALVSIFIGSKDDNVQAYNQEINKTLKNPDNSSDSLQELVQDAVTTRLSTVS
jgi:hypothetical protein